MQYFTAPAVEAPDLTVDLFGAGHPGELTRYVPFDLVDAVLAETGRIQKRLRLLLSRVGVYFLLALGLFPQLGYLRVWGMLTGAVPGAARVSEKALRDVRRRVGPRPVKVLFETLAVPAADLALRVCDTGAGEPSPSTDAHRCTARTPSATAPGSDGPRPAAEGSTATRSCS